MKDWNCISRGHVIDVLITYILHTPFVVFFWRGTWMLETYYIYPSNAELSCWICMGTGLVVNVVMYTTQSLQERHFTGLSPVPYVITSRLYTYVFAVSIVSHWRGLWTLLDLHIEINWLNDAIITGLAALALFLLRSYINVLCVPVMIDVDFYRSRYFKVSTRFHSKVNMPWFVPDALFTATVIHSLIIVVWRGLWHFLDLALFPDQMSATALYSLVIGYGVAIATMSIQNYIARISKCLEKQILCKIITEDLFILTVCVAPVSCWRGLWFLQDLYLFPSHEQLSYWVSHATGYLGLIILGSGNSLLVRGCKLDGEMADGEGVKADLEYFAHFKMQETPQTESLINNAKDINGGINDDTNGGINDINGDIADKPKDKPCTEIEQKLIL
ncbi:hypothetical protein SNE40_017162 [Patella caerulea]|uniref:Fuseless n=2 Tax=Patella caerulea TaxID=87958 RepID=A0AAN8J9V8_PATCE